MKKWFLVASVLCGGFSAVAQDIIRGGDISMLTLVEDNGGKYKNTNNQERECLSLLTENGMNCARLRLYNDPGNPDFDPSNRLPAGYQNEEDVLRLARRAKEAGMQILLTFHYSDYWTNGETQTKPHDWAELSFLLLRRAVRRYTSDFLTKMKEQGTLPEYVSIGNETQSGMLYPDGSHENMTQLCQLYGAASAGVRDVSKDIKVIVHLAGGGDATLYRWHFGELKKNNVDYDIIGASYYPFWTEKTIEEISDWATVINQEFNKPVLLMEVGYAWRKTLPDGSNGQLYDNGPYTSMTPTGQKDFMEQLFNTILANDALIGLVYWDPIFIPAGDAGWELGGKNVVANSTLFSFYGKAQPALATFKTGLPDAVRDVKNEDVSCELSSNVVYDLSGRKIAHPSSPKGVYIINGQKRVDK